MKYALLIAFVFVGLWLWQRSRANSLRNGAGRAKDAGAAAASPKPEGSTALQMVACSTCGLHLPKADALTGKIGSYCCAAHQRQADDALD